MSASPPSRNPLSNRIALASLCAALTATALATPAQAALVDDLPTTRISTTAIPEDSATTVRFENRDATPLSATFPAGTYWVSHVNFSAEWVSLLGDAGDPRATHGATWQRVDLSTPGDLSVQIETVGQAGHTHTLAVYPMPVAAGDPATMTHAELDAAFDAYYPTQHHGAPTDEVTVVAATVPRTTPLTEPSAHGETAAGYAAVQGDFLGIGVATTAKRIGNTFTFDGLNGEVHQMRFGRAGDEVFVGDFDGDGRESIALRRGNVFFIDNDFTGGAPDQQFSFGRATDEVYVGDFHGTGADTVSLRRGNTFFASGVTLGQVAAQFSFGRPTDWVEVADWDRDGRETIGVLRETGEGPLTLLLRNSLTSGPADLQTTVRS